MLPEPAKVHIQGRIVDDRTNPTIYQNCEPTHISQIPVSALTDRVWLSLLAQ